MIITLLVIENGKKQMEKNVYDDYSNESIRIYTRIYIYMFYNYSTLNGITYTS